MSILAFHGLSQSYGAVDVFHRLTESIAYGDRVGLVGPNGIGKTTLLRILAGVEQPAGGHFQLVKQTALGYLHQEAADAFGASEQTVYDAMLTVFTHLQETAAVLARYEARMADGEYSDELLSEYGALQEQFEQQGGYDYEVRIQQILTGLGFPPERWQMPLEHCSGGQKTRALLARLLLEKPDLLVMDEPTNHLDIEAIEWLEGFLQKWEGSLLIVSHDRYFLDRVVNRIWEMSRAGLEHYRGNYGAYLKQRDERWRYRDEQHQGMIDDFMIELDFIKRNIARASTRDRAFGRLRILSRNVLVVEHHGQDGLKRNFIELNLPSVAYSVAEVEHRIKELPHPTPRSAYMKIQLPEAERSGDIALRTYELEVGYDGETLVHMPDIEIRRGERIAIVGPNGAGKSTLLKTLLKQLTPIKGRYQLGANVQVGYFSQAHIEFDRLRSVLDTILGLRNLPIGQARDYLARFLFRGDDVFKLVDSLSGGERGRLALAAMALQSANLLLLDEPTNHLDVYSREILQEALLKFEGTLILVSHDRYLIDKLATTVWEIEDGEVEVHNTVYETFRSKRPKALA